jgi:3-oxoacyl-[acyl-carrier protein] reductase
MSDQIPPLVVVTGGAQGLGLAYARALSGKGWRIVLADIAGELARTSAKSIVADGGDAHGVSVDVSDPESVEKAFAQIAEDHGPVSGLVNNAGGAFIPPAATEEMEFADFLRVLGVNAGGTWLCSRAVIPGMKAAGLGKIVNVSSTCFSKGGPPGMVPYIAAKGAVVGLTRALARELGPFGVTVNAVAPGYTPVDTLGRVNTGERAARMRVQIVAEQCINRLEVPGDLVGTVAFLMSEESDFVTGQVINVDGGWVHG